VSKVIPIRTLLLLVVSSRIGRLQDDLFAYSLRSTLLLISTYIVILPITAELLIIRLPLTGRQKSSSVFPDTACYVLRIPSSGLRRIDDDRRSVI
jgi:TRAP-type mannitol/chloroaromatic compound transport system permease large subunit